MSENTTDTRPNRFRKLVEVMASQPGSVDAQRHNRNRAARVEWLLALSDALNAAGLDEDAAHVLNAAVNLIHAAVNEMGK
jgi:hypothetical protein